jgi:hypothetical protein
VSYGPDGGPRKPVLPEEDDWFATPFEDPVETDEVAWQDDVPALPPRPPRDELAQRQLLVVGAVIAIVVVVGAGFLVARSLGGSDDTTATSTATVPTTPSDTTPVDTTPTATTPATTTPATTTPATTTPNVTSVPTDTTLRPGDSGSSVTSLQQALTQLGYEAGTADGTYGPATTAAVAAFQKAEGLTEDGIAGPTTLTAINTALAAG